jgi:hypothetical protein
MPYDASKDKLVKKWTCDETGLVVSINQYDNGEPKVQIGPRLVAKKDGTHSQRKPGRLTMEDLLWLYDIIDEVKEDMTRLVDPA